MNQLKHFVEMCESNPSILADPTLSFFRDYLERSVSPSEVSPCVLNAICILTVSLNLFCCLCDFDQSRSKAPSLGLWQRLQIGIPCALISIYMSKFVQLVVSQLVFCRSKLMHGILILDWLEMAYMHFLRVFDCFIIGFRKFSANCTIQEFMFCRYFRYWSYFNNSF